MPKKLNKQEEDLIEITNIEKTSVESAIVELTAYNNKLNSTPKKVFDDRLAKLDKTLLTGLGDDMRNHLTQLRTKIEQDGETDFINKEKIRINQYLLIENNKKTELDLQIANLVDITDIPIN